LRERELDQVLVHLKQPFLGICLGMQLMCNHSEEGDTKCLGIFDTDVKLFRASSASGLELKVPHMGWNSLSSESLITPNSELLTNIQSGSDVYYVHSYYAEICDYTIAQCDYILPFSSVLQKDNFYATQFHPEKSAGIGEQILRNFIGLP
jgi:glutamine amidotransferase